MAQGIHAVEQVIAPRAGAINGEKRRIQPALARLGQVELNAVVRRLVLAQISNSPIALVKISALCAVYGHAPTDQGDDAVVVRIND